MRARQPVVSLVATVALVGCGGASTGAATGRASQSDPAAQSGPAIRSAQPLSARPRTSTAAAMQTPPASAAGATTYPQRLRGVDHARQLVVATARGYGTSYATVRVFAKTSHGWVRKFGPWPARIGRNGFAPRGDKREGDGRTPTGSFTVPFMFGVAPDPGAHFRYRRALSSSRWDDDPSSRNYNRWVDTRTGYPGRAPEHMRVLPVYRYGAVIGYNLDRTPGLGSAIFFHVTDGNATAGCVAVARSHVVKVLRWLRPARHPRFIMGTTSAVTR